MRKQLVDVDFDVEIDRFLSSISKLRKPSSWSGLQPRPTWKSKDKADPEFFGKSIYRFSFEPQPHSSFGIEIYAFKSKSTSTGMGQTAFQTSAISTALNFPLLVQTCSKIAFEDPRKLLNVSNLKRRLVK
jgi:hypothetical protein